MPDAAIKTNQAAYEARCADGTVYGAIGPRDWNRFAQTLRFVPKDARSLLDAGCDRGHWLAFVNLHRQLQSLTGVDVSQSRVDEARARYPDLDFRVGFLEDLDIEPRSFDVVTSLEVLEHIPNWEGVLDSLLRLARRRVLITVPNEEEIQQTICVHCGQVTPMYGHLHRFDRSSFPERPGWHLSFGHIRDHGIGATLARRIYRTILPRPAWLVTCYDRLA